MTYKHPIVVGWGVFFSFAVSSMDKKVDCVMYNVQCTLYIVHALYGSKTDFEIDRFFGVGFMSIKRSGLRRRNCY